ASAGIGDMDSHIEEGRVGALLQRHDRAAYAEALREVEELRRDPALAERCRAEARVRYDLREVGAARYRRLYDELQSLAVSRPRGGRRPETARPRDLVTFPLRVLALASYPTEAAASRFRVAQFIEPLAARGIDLTFSPFLDAPLFASLYRPAKLLARLPRLLFRTFARL